MTCTAVVFKLFSPFMFSMYREENILKNETNTLHLTNAKKIAATTKIQDRYRIRKIKSFINKVNLQKLKNALKMMHWYSVCRKAIIALKKAKGEIF